MKYVLVTAFFVFVSGCIALGGSYETGTGRVYEGEGQGYRGPIRVLVHIDGGRITEIEIVDSTEDIFVGGQAIEELLDMVTAYNTTDLDAISGATESSKGFLEAVENAIMDL
ncbi:MAG: FMN-binding protein [Treponema sp.]|jgi:uncharacterized protein with FMN-binding domain|nr:FMN-binding protein [Treponema sp.]